MNSKSSIVGELVIKMQIKLSRSIRFGIILFFVMMTAGIGLADDMNMGVVGQFNGDVFAVAVAGDYAYIGQGQDLVILDISNVDNPSEVGRVTTPSEVYNIAVSDNYAYIANNENGISIVDVTTPSSPSLVGSYDTDGAALDIAVSGNYAYIADGSGLVILDISTPSSPSLKGIYNNTNGSVNGVAISGNYAYVADDAKGIFDGSNGLDVVDISNPSSPSLVGSYDSIYAYDVAVSGNYAYVADYSGLGVLDISNPSSPNLVSNYNSGGDTNDVAVSGNYVYVTDYSGLSILDISTPSSPSLVNSYTTSDANGVAVSGNYVYITDPSNGLLVLQQGTQTKTVVSENNSTLDSSIEENNSTPDSSVGSGLGATVEFSGIGDKSVIENEPLTFTISATDVNGSTITYSAKDMPAGATLNATTGIFSWTPATGTAGDYIVTFIAESNGVTGSETITITVVASDMNLTLPESATSLQETGISETETNSGTSEDIGNLTMRDVASAYITKDTNITYEFTGEGNDIQSVSFYSLQNSGNITSTVEVLNNRSKLVNSNPEGLVYKYTNIWIGDSGFDTEANIKNAQVKFKVNSSWLQERGLTEADVKLQRYNGAIWEKLPTTLESNTMGYAVFESQTPGFSSFAITAEKALASSANDDTDTKPLQVGTTNQTQAGKSNILIIVMFVLLIGIFTAGYFYLKKGHN